MTQLLRRCPYFDKATHVTVGGESVLVRPHQIVVWVSVTLREMQEWNTAIPRFPAILDTGHTHNFSVSEDHLRHWAGVTPELLPLIGHVRELDRRIPLRNAGLWLHRNESGERDRLTGVPARLLVPRGIAVYPADAGFPRLPVLGLRAITANRIVLRVDGERRELSARIHRWRLW
jgi:hypothetical protein